MRIAVAGGTGTVGAMVVAHARAAGHEVRVLSRSEGIDLTAQVPDLAGTDAVIDVSGVSATSARKSRDFFGAVTSNLLRAGAAAGVSHHLALSIVGAMRAPRGYYAGKALQEHAVVEGNVPWTILRATQFFEFAEHTATPMGPWLLSPKMRSQPLAADTVARRIVDLIAEAPQGNATEIAGLREYRMVELARAIFNARGEKKRLIEVPLPGGFGRAIRNGSILPGPDAELLGPSFDDWLAARTN